MNFEQIRKLEDRILLSCLSVGKESLPPRYRGKADRRTLKSLLGQLKRETNKKKPEVDQRSEHVMFDHNTGALLNGQSNSKRLKAIENYRTDVENDRQIKYDINEHLLYQNECAFVGGMINGGLCELS